MGDFIVPDTAVKSEDTGVDSDSPAEEPEDNSVDGNPTYEYNEDPVKPTE